MSTQLSAAQAAQQSNRGPSGRYAHAQHQEPSLVVLSTPNEVFDQETAGLGLHERKRLEFEKRGEIYVPPVNNPALLGVACG